MTTPHQQVSHPEDHNCQTRRSINQLHTVHQKILQRDNTRSSTVSLKDHKVLQQKMRKRIDASNRDLLTQALHYNDTTQPSFDPTRRNSIFAVINQAHKFESNTHNLIHTVASFDQALNSAGSALKVLVMVGFKVINVLRIDHVHLTFYATFEVYVEWNDPHLINKTPTSIHWPDHFDPDIACVNFVEATVFENRKELINATTGLVQQTISLKGTLTIHETSFAAFPYDYQDLRIQIKSKTYPQHCLLLVSEGTALIQHHPREEFLLAGLRTEVYTTNPHASRCGNSYSTMHIVVMVERDPTWYQRNIIITLSLIWFAAMVVLFMPFSTYDALGYRMESAIALLLASVATKFTVTEHLPKVSVLTFCEAHMTICFCGILFNIFTSIVLYLVEKYISSDSNSTVVDRTDSSRFEHRQHYYGGQPCAYPAMVMAYTITFFTLASFIGWHVRMCWLAKQHRRKRDRWRTLALPESLESCGRPLPSILTQFNGQDTPVAKARDHLLSKFANHLRRRSAKGESKGGEGGEGMVPEHQNSLNSVYAAKASPQQTRELIKEHSVNALF